MPTQIVRVFLATPGSMGKERDLFSKAVEDANHIAAKLGVSFLPRKWEYVSPDLHPSGEAQERIEEELAIEECDVLVAALWRDPGSLGPDDQFRTEREVRKAIKQRKLRGTKPAIFAYFCTKEYSPSSAEEAKRHSQVLDFKQSIQSEGLLTKNYREVEDFRYKLFSHLIDFLVTSLGSGEAFSCSVNADVQVIRNEGYTELIGDITIDVSIGARRGVRESVSLTLLTNASITNRILDNGLLDVELISESELSACTYARHITATSIEFDPILVESEKTHRLVIRGLRFNAMFLGVSAALPRNFAQGQLTIINTDTKQAVSKSLILAYIERGLGVEAPKYVTEWSDSGCTFVAFTQTFVELFAGAFKNRMEERGDYGTTLALYFSSVPNGARVFITSRDIPIKPTSTSQDLMASALAREVSPNGDHPKASTLIEAPRWLDGTPMTEVGLNECAAWEIVAADNREELRRLVFGVVIATPTGVRSAPSISSLLAPFYSTATAMTVSESLPIPRFVSWGPVPKPQLVPTA
ncbi:MAG TPA: hypothetical protein VGN17_23775 [Bryobacteraceae bacterium]|jgi:hypothetical protein